MAGNEFRYSVANDKALDSLLAGKDVEESVAFFSGAQPSVPRAGYTGVLWSRADASGGRARPLALISREEDMRRLCGRYAQLHGELSPLSTWCHLLSPKFWEPLDGLVRQPDLEGWEAAWVGLVIAETMLTAEKPLSSIRISACLASQSFAIARTNSLWYAVPQEETLRRFEFANETCRADGSLRRANKTSLLRAAMQPIWTVLEATASPLKLPRDELRFITSGIVELRAARLNRDELEARALSRPLLEVVPEAEPFERLMELTPENRLRLFDTLVNALSAVSDQPARRKIALTVLAGYLATVAAGGAPSLALAESHADRWPEITAWAYLIGGIGERVLWTSAFDGLGRLVSRELQRPFRLDEPPTSDFALDELVVLADKGLKDPLVNLKVKQARLVTVAIFPGVNISVPLAEFPGLNSSKSDTARLTPPDPMLLLADALWPHLRRKMDDYLRGRASQDLRERSRLKRKSSSQSQLPLPDDPKKVR